MNQLKAGVALNYVIIALNTVVGLGYMPYMLRCLGQNEYGLYSLVASVISYLTILDFGFGNAITRYTAKFRAEGKLREQYEMFGMFVIVYSIIGLIALCGGLVLYFNVDALFDRTMTPSELSQARTMMLLLTVNLAVTFPLSVFGSIITAYEKFIFSKTVNILRILLSTTVMIAVLAVGYKAVALTVVQTVFNILTLLLNYLYCKKKLKIPVIFGNFNMPFLKEIGIYSFWIFLTGIMDRIYWGTGQFILGHQSGTAAVAVFSVAITLQQMYFMFSASISGVVLPRLTAMVSTSNNHREISDFFIRTGRLQCLVLSFILSGFIVFGQGFIDIWAGKDYATSYLITAIFFVVLFVPFIQTAGISILEARNQMQFRSMLYLVMSLVSLGLQIVLSKSMGALGCAIAIGVGVLLGHGLVMNIYFRKKQAIDIKEFWRQICGMLVVPAIFTIAGLLSGHYIDYSHPLNLIAGIAIFSALFLPFEWAFSMNQYERSILTSLLARFTRHR